MKNVKRRSFLSRRIAARRQFKELNPVSNVRTRRLLASKVSKIFLVATKTITGTTESLKHRLRDATLIRSRTKREVGGETEEKTSKQHDKTEPVQMHKV